MNQVVLTLIGWTHVHTWRESHGNYSDHIYQKDPGSSPWSRRVELLHVTVYHDSAYGGADRTTGVRVETGPFTHDYLLARDIRANPTRYEPVGERSISPCYTAGHENFHDRETGRTYRIFGAAGHGEWAFEIQDEDLDPNQEAGGDAAEAHSNREVG